LISILNENPRSGKPDSAIFKIKIPQQAWFGITTPLRFVVIPWGGGASKLKLPYGLFYFPSVASESKLSSALQENKKSRQVGIN